MTMRAKTSRSTVGTLSPTFLGRVGRTPLLLSLTRRRFQMSSRKGIKIRLFRTNTPQCWFWVYPQFATITLDLCMHSLHNLTMFLFLCMPVIVHNGTDHVEQKRRALRRNKISCIRRSMVGAKAAPHHPFRIVIKRKIPVLGGIQKEKTTPIYPMRSSL